MVKVEQDPKSAESDTDTCVNAFNTKGALPSHPAFLSKEKKVKMSGSFLAAKSSINLRDVVKPVEVYSPIQNPHYGSSLRNQVQVNDNFENSALNLSQFPPLTPIHNFDEEEKTDQLILESFGLGATDWFDGLDSAEAGVDIFSTSEKPNELRLDRDTSSKKLSESPQSSMTSDSSDSTQNSSEQSTVGSNSGKEEEGPCPFRKGRRASSRNTQRKRKRNASGEFICRVDGCYEVFEDRKALRRHKLLHRERKHFCPVEGCDRGFFEKSKLNRHMVVHNKTKVYTCPICDKKFGYKANVKTHMRVHTGEKPYECRHRGCTKSFAQASNRNAHEKTHEKKKGKKKNEGDKSPLKRQRKDSGIEYIESETGGFMNSIEETGLLGRQLSDHQLHLFDA